MRKFILPVIMLLGIILTTSCKGVKDLLEAIEKYGYKSTMPLGDKKIPVEQQLLGGFVYNAMPLVISKKDEFTYLITFLTTELEGSNTEIEAWMTELDNSRYLNLEIGDVYSFLKIKPVYNNECEIRLLRSTIDPYVTPSTLKSWLLKHGREDQFITPDSSTIDIFYSFNFDKISPERAYLIQAETLQDKKISLFGSCSSYYQYESLAKKYPGDPLLAGARENLLKKCESLEDFKTFIKYFPDDILAEKAKMKIGEITTFIADSTNYAAAKRSNTIEAYQGFIADCKIRAYKDSAQSRIIPLVQKITKDDIEWRWTGGKRNEAVQYILYKIDYSGDSLDKDWYSKHLTLYNLKIAQTASAEVAVQYFDKMVSQTPTHDELLNLYICKGFLYWSMGSFDLSLEAFKAKISEHFNDNGKDTYRKAIRLRYKEYQNEKIVFPDEKQMWRKIKKL
jgi:hypothetical protein